MIGFAIAMGSKQDLPNLTEIREQFDSMLIAEPKIPSIREIQLRQALRI